MISPNIGAALAEPVAGIYAEAELAILARIAQQLGLGLDADDWDTTQLARLQQVRAEVLAELQIANPAAADALQQQLDAGYDAGQASAMRDVGQALDPLKAQTADKVQAVAALARDAADALQSAQPGILRAVDDVYRRVVADATAQVLTGSTTRRDAVQSVIGKLLGQGIKGIETKRGTMDLETYATMAVRTATARSAIAGHEGVMDAMGLDLVIIHPGPRACDICDKWARMILARKGASGAFTVTSLTTGELLHIDVGATLTEARAAGWGHPNCRCNLSTYMPGVTQPDEIERPPWDQDGYEAQQRQRSIERSIRDAKRQQAIAMTPAAKAAATAQVKGQQARLRDHLAQHPELKRQSGREQLGSGLGPGSAPRDAPGTPPRDPSKPLRRDAQPTLKPVEPEPSPTDKAMRAIGEAKTHEAVADALRERWGDDGRGGNIKVEGFNKPGNVSLSQAKAFATTVTRLLDDIPDLRRIGTIALRAYNNGRGANAKAAMAYVSSVGQKLDKTASISLNTAFSLDGGNMTHGVQNSIRHGWFHGEADDDTSALEYIVQHEVGHLVDFGGGGDARKAVQTKLVQQAKASDGISGYAKTSSTEMVAEAFATMRTAPHLASDAERSIYERTMRAFNEGAARRAAEDAAVENRFQDMLDKLHRDATGGGA